MMIETQTTEVEVTKYDPFWRAYLDGMTQRHDGTPAVVVRVFTDWHDGQPGTELNFKLYRQATNKIVGWHDGPKSAMYRFLHWEAIDPSHLHSEISKIVGEWKTEEERKDLLEVRKWAIRQDQMTGTLVKLSEAFVNLTDAFSHTPEVSEDLRAILIAEAIKEPKHG